MENLTFERTESRPHILNVHLNINGKPRLIGVIDESFEGTFMAARNEKHLFKKTDSLGMNYELLASPDVQFKWILFDYCGRKLVSTRQYFLKKGKVFQFKGYELQMFIPLAELNILTARAFEMQEQVKTVRAKHPDLFNGNEAA